MIIVNVWDAVHGSVLGHASMILPATDYLPELTISWWPVHGGASMLFGDEAANLPYDGDEGSNSEIAFEGRVPERRYRLHGLRDAANGVTGAREGIGLNEAAIREWWASWSEDGRYRITDRNCCTTVIAGLLAGGAREYTDGAGLVWIPPEHSGVVMTPQRVHQVCQAIQTGMLRSRF